MTNKMNGVEMMMNETTRWRPEIRVEIVAVKLYTAGAVAGPEAQLFAVGTGWATAVRHLQLTTTTVNKS